MWTEDLVNPVFILNAESNLASHRIKMNKLDIVKEPLLKELDSFDGSGSFLPGEEGKAGVEYSPVSFGDAVTGATTYYHQIDMDQSMQNPVQSSLSSSSVTVTPESTGTWWWRVRIAVEG